MKYIFGVLTPLRQRYLRQSRYEAGDSSLGHVVKPEILQFTVPWECVFCSFVLGTIRYSCGIIFRLTPTDALSNYLTLLLLT